MEPYLTAMEDADMDYFVDEVKLKYVAVQIIKAAVDLNEPERGELLARAGRIM